MTLTELQHDALREMVNIGVGRAASILNQMLEHPIQLQVPEVEVLPVHELAQALGNLAETRLASVQLGFKGAFSGVALLLFPTNSASNLVALLTGEAPGTPDLDSLRSATLTEVGNILVNGVMGAIANAINHPISYTLPQFTEDYLRNILTREKATSNAFAILAKTHFTVEKLLIEGDIIITFEMGSFSTFLMAIDALIAEIE